MRIHECARRGDLDGVRAALAAGEPVDARHPESGNTALAEAASSRAGTPELVRLLLDAGADPNGGDKWGVTPLRSVSNLSDETAVAILDLLVEAGADVNLESRHVTPLAWARTKNNDAVANALIRHGAELPGDSTAELDQK